MQGTKRRTRRRLLLACGGIGLAVVLLTGMFVAQTWRKNRAADSLLSESAQFEQEGDWRRAAERIEGYLKICPLDDAVRVRLANLYSSGAETTAERERAIDLLYRALGTGSSDAETLRPQLAEHLLHCERWPEAEAEAGKLLQIRPEEPQLLRIRAVALARQYRSGDLRHEVPSKLPVLGWLAAAHKANPCDLELTELLADALLDTELVIEPAALDQPDRSECARACWAALIACRPQDARVHLARYQFRIRWRIDGAIGDLDQALRWGSDDPVVLQAAAQAAQQRAAVLQGRGLKPLAKEELRVAKELYQRAICADPSQPLCHLGLGKVLLAEGEPQAALVTLQRAIAAFPHQTAVFYGSLADAWLELGNTREAQSWMDALDEGLEYEPESALDLARLATQAEQEIRRGRIHLLQSAPQLAIEPLQKALALQQRSGGTSDQAFRAWSLLGEAFANEGRWSESAEAYDNAVLEQPFAVDGMLAAANAYLRCGEADLALQRADQAVRLDASEASKHTQAKALVAVQDHARTAHAEKNGLLTVEELHRLEWPNLASVHRVMRGQNAGHSPSLVFLDAPSAVPLVRARVFALRGEYEAAEETLSESWEGYDPRERMGVYREILQQRLARNDLEEARALLADMVRLEPGNVPLLDLAAEIGLRYDHAQAERKQNESGIEQLLP